MLHFNKKAFKTLTFTFILSIIPALASAAAPVYIPAPGPLTLGDSYAPIFPGGPLVIKRGLIMQTIDEDESLIDKAILHVFTKTPVHAQLPLYQDIIESLKTSLNNARSIAVLEVFERAIMKRVHYEHYIYYTEGKWTNMFFTGIQKPSFDWLTLSTSADISQLMHELKQLAQIAKRHSLALSLRLNNKADSYLYWKTRTLKTLGALITAGGLYYYRDNIRDNLKNALSQFYGLTNSAYSTGSNWANTAYTAGASLGNYTSSLAGSAYSTGANWTNYLGSYVPSYSAKQ